MVVVVVVMVLMVLLVFTKSGYSPMDDRIRQVHEVDLISADDGCGQVVMVVMMMMLVFTDSDCPLVGDGVREVQEDDLGEPDHVHHGGQLQPRLHRLFLWQHHLPLQRRQARQDLQRAQKTVGAVSFCCSSSMRPDDS